MPCDPQQLHQEKLAAQQNVVIQAAAHVEELEGRMKAQYEHQYQLLLSRLPNLQLETREPEGSPNATAPGAGYELPNAAPAPITPTTGGNVDQGTLNTDPFVGFHLRD